MGIGILAPVPAVLLKSAMEACAREGVVAFGTNARDVFDKVERDYGAGIPVIIQPTVTYGDPDGYGRKTFSARFVRFQKADDRGLHPNPARRPARALDPSDPDTPAQGFWEVEELAEMPTRIALGSLKAEGKKTPLPPTFKLHGPLLVTASFL